MKSTIQQVVATVMVIVLCLSAQVGLLMIGNSFRVAARMAAPAAGAAASTTEVAVGPIQVAATSLPGARW